MSHTQVRISQKIKGVKMQTLWYTISYVKKEISADFNAHLMHLQ